MKVLVAAACVAIIAFVGYFFWERYDERRRSSIEFRCEELRQAYLVDRQAIRQETDRQLVRDCGRYFDQQSQ